MFYERDLDDWKAMLLEHWEKLLLGGVAMLGMIYLLPAYLSPPQVLADTENLEQLNQMAIQRILNSKPTSQDVLPYLALEWITLKKGRDRAFW